MSSFEKGQVVVLKREMPFVDLSSNSSAFVFKAGEVFSIQESCKEFKQELALVMEGKCLARGSVDMTYAIRELKDAKSYRLIHDKTGKVLSYVYDFEIDIISNEEKEQ